MKIIYFLIWYGFVDTRYRIFTLVLYFLGRCCQTLLLCTEPGHRKCEQCACVALHSNQSGTLLLCTEPGHRKCEQCACVALHFNQSGTLLLCTEPGHRKCEQCACAALHFNQSGKLLLCTEPRQRKCEQCACVALHSNQSGTLLLCTEQEIGRQTNRLPQISHWYQMNKIHFEIEKFQEPIR